MNKNNCERQEIQQTIEDAVISLFPVHHSEWGDHLHLVKCKKFRGYGSNICLNLSRIMLTSPVKVASLLKKHIEKVSTLRVSVSSDGYLNVKMD